MKTVGTHTNLSNFDFLKLNMKGVLKKGRFYNKKVLLLKWKSQVMMKRKHFLQKIQI